MADESHKKTQAQVTGEGSALRRYQDLIIGNRSLGSLIYYEFCMWVGALPGALGIVFRKIFWRRLFSECGAGVLFGAHVVVRHPQKIKIGQRCVISDGCVLDARSDAAVAIEIGNDGILSNYVMISCKSGEVKIGEQVGIGAQTIVHAVNGSVVEIGSEVMIGPNCYFAGGGNYETARTDISMANQGLKPGERVVLGSDIWLGAGVRIMPGVSIGNGCIVGAGAVVTKSLQAYSISGGVPARVIDSRSSDAE